MRSSQLFAVAAGVLLVTSAGMAAEISGEYIESRTCDVYTGPCFANAEMDLAGKEALMAWKVDKGTWNGVPLKGLGAALVITSDKTLGYDGIFAMKEGKTKAVVLVDERANEKQHAALVAFVKDSAKEFSQNVVKVEKVPFELKNDHLSGIGTFQAGKVAQIQTRGMKADDCVCTNEMVYYQPLTDVQDFSPAYSVKMSYDGKALNNQWTHAHLRSSFLATFRR